MMHPTEGLLSASGKGRGSGEGLAVQHRGIGVACDGVEALLCSLLRLDQLLVPRIQVCQPGLSLLQRLLHKQMIF